MSEDASKPEAQEPEKEVEAEVPRESRSSSSLPTILSGIAVLLAAAALVISLQGQHKISADPMQAINMKLSQMEARISNLESQLASNKVDVAHTQLNRILLDLKHVSALVGNTARNKIDQAYQLLKPLIPAAMQKSAPETKAPSTSETQAQTSEPATDQANEAAAPGAGKNGKQTSSAADKTSDMPNDTGDSGSTQDTAPTSGAAPAQ